MFEKLKSEIDRLKTGGYKIEEFYRVYGRCQMAYELGAIGKDEFMALNHAVVADGINNSKYF